MDRSSSIGNKWNRDLSSDERLEKANRHADSLDPSDASSGSVEQSFAPTPASPALRSKQPASTSSASPVFADDEAKQLDHTAWTSVHAFSDMPAEFITVFHALRKIEQSAFTKHQTAREQAKNDPDLQLARAFIKSGARSGKDLEDSKHYQLLRGNRSGKSLMEGRLPLSSSFRSLLYPPTGGVRDTRTGLYAELDVIKIDGESIGLLCFPGTGVADNQDAQWKANLQQALGAGKLPRLYNQALGLAEELKTALARDGLELRVAGHSLGGGVVNFIGLTLNMDSYCFNAAALGKKSLEFLKLNGCLTQERINRQRHVTLEGDFASSPKLSKAIKVVARSSQTPTQIGKVYLGAKAHEDFPQSSDPRARHPLSAMEDMMHAQKLELWEKARQSVAQPSGSSASTPPASPPASPPTSTSGQPAPASTRKTRSSARDEADGSETN